MKIYAHSVTMILGKSMDFTCCGMYRTKWINGVVEPPGTIFHEETKNGHEADHMHGIRSTLAAK
jgi:uncharacterized protein YodC (DUF2158 family)